MNLAVMRRGPVRMPIDLRRWLRALTIALLAFVAAGCAQTKSFLSNPDALPSNNTARVLLMPLDIELSVLTAAGLLEPNAEWTEQARENVEIAIEEVLLQGNEDVVLFEEDDNATAKDAEVQLVKLHGTVGRTILLHKYLQGYALPTKKDRFDWTLGKNAVALRKKYDADYALFVYFRDSFSSGGRAAVIFVGALLGVGIQGGTQVGFASLVDLRSGDVVWFNRLVSGAGDLRKPDLARSAAENILSELPL